MPKFSINALAGMTGKTRATIRARLDGLPFDDGGKDGKLFDSKTALEKIYSSAGANGATFVSNTEAQRLLTLARKEQIDLQNEVIRKERIPIADVSEINDLVYGNVAWMIKRRLGKVFDLEAINDLLAELRTIPDKIREVLDR